MPDTSRNESPSRSPLLFDPNRSVLLVVDIQERLVPKILHFPSMLFHVQQLIEAAKMWNIPILVSEQYPEKLGATVQPLASTLPAAESKRMFSCRELWPIWKNRLPEQCDTLIVCGIESHVCIQQTCFDFQSLGWNVVLPVDAISARFEIDHQVALRRMESSGMLLTTTESLLFEWCVDSLHPNFKGTSEIVKRRSAS